MFFHGSAFGNSGQFLALVDFVVYVQSAVAGSEFGDVWVSVVAWADYVSVNFEFA